MPRFFVRSSQINGDTVTVTGDDAHHISRSLRMAVGDKLTVCDMQGCEYDCVLTAFLPDAVTATVTGRSHRSVEPPCHITLYQALPKGDKMDTVIQKAVECGVGRIVPFESERCVVRFKPEAEPHKQQRRQRIADEAAKQCGRGVQPAVMPTVTFARMLDEASAADLVLFCYEGDGTVPLGALLESAAPKAGESIAVVIGSEGGFSQSEAAAAAARGFSMAGLGPRILRTETASGFVLACLCMKLELS